MGAKLKTGGDIKLSDLWYVPGDEDEAPDVPAWAATSIELRKEILQKLKAQNDSTGDNNKG